MSYSTIADIQTNFSLRDRCIAGVASEISAGAPGDSQFAPAWVSQRSWDLAATPSWADKWESAEASGVTDPGASEVVITDADILARLQQLLAQYPMPDGSTIP